MSSEVQTLAQIPQRGRKSHGQALCTASDRRKICIAVTLRGKCIWTFSPTKPNTGNGRRNTSLWPRLQTSKSSLWTTTLKGPGRNRELRMRMSVGSLFSAIKKMYRAHLERFCAPAYVQQEAVDQVTSLLSRHPQRYDASVLEEQCARVKAGAQLVVRQSFVVKAEQLRVKQQKEKCRQRTLESAQAEYEAMNARSFVVALQLEAAGLKRLTTEDKQRGKPARYVDQSSALGSLLVEREDMQQAYGIKVWPNSCKNPGVLRAKILRISRQSSFDIQVREIRFENECEVNFSSQPMVSEVASFGGFKGFRARQEYRGLKGKQQCSSKEPHRQRRRSWTRQQQRT